MIQLPPYNDGTDRQQTTDYTITLSDVLFRIVIEYKDRLDRYYLYLYDADDEPLLMGKKLSVDTPLLSQYEIDGLPDGELMLLDTSDAGAECGFEDLGVRCVLLYVPTDEIPVETADTYTIEASP